VNTIVLPCDLHWDVIGITESDSRSALDHVFRPIPACRFAIRHNSASVKAGDCRGDGALEKCHVCTRPAASVSCRGQHFHRQYRILVLT
jgi:hypothetical protein